MSNDASNRNSGALSAKVLEISDAIHKLVARAKQPGHSRKDWDRLADFFAVDGFERTGIWREKMSWDDYLDFMVPWAEFKDFDSRLRRITEVGSLVFFELEEHHIKDGGVTIVNSMNVYEFDDDGKIRHLDVYLQGRLGTVAFNAPE